MENLGQIERALPLRLDSEEDARVGWPMRWLEVGRLVFRLKAENRKLVKELKRGEGASIYSKEILCSCGHPLQQMLTDRPTTRFRLHCGSCEAVHVLNKVVREGGE